MNKGEKAEIYLKAFLLKEKDKSLRNTIFGKISSLSDDGNLETLTWKDSFQSHLDNFEFEKIMKYVGIEKSPGRSKADITINNVNYSVKLKNERPSIINHTTRPGFENVCCRIGLKINEFDTIISEYWQKRLGGIITEDVYNRNPMSPFQSHKNYLLPIINYFVFDGTGSGDSAYKADEVLEVDYSSLPNNLKIINKNDYFDSVWPKLDFSIRGGGASMRGMPKTYPNCKNSASIGKWTRKTKDGYKGALSVRVG